MMLAGGVLFLGGTIVGIWLLPKDWRHETHFYDKVPTSWPWGEAAWWGFVRAMPASCFGGAFFAAYGFWSYFSERLPLWFKIYGAITLGLYVFFALTLYLFSWPKIIQFPWVRDKPYAVQIWKKKLEKRKAKRI